MSSPMTTEPGKPQSPEPGRFHWGRWLVLLIIAAISGLFLAFGPDEEMVIHRSGEWRKLAQEHLIAALAAFFVAEVVLVASSIPVGIWLTVLAGFLFGTWLGTAVVNMAATLGAVLAFLSGRYVLAETIRNVASRRPRLAHWLATLDAGFREHGAYYMLLLRLTPVLPFFVMNMGLGLTCVRLRDYWWATQLGMLPITLVVASAGDSLGEITSFRNALSMRTVLSLSLLPLVPYLLHHTLGKRLRVMTARIEEAQVDPTST